MNMICLMIKNESHYSFKVSLPIWMLNLLNEPHFKDLSKDYKLVQIKGLDICEDSNN